MIGKVIGIALVLALLAGSYALARGDGPMTYYMDDNAMLSQYLVDSAAMASDTQAADADESHMSVAKHRSPLLQSQD